MKKYKSTLISQVALLTLLCSCPIDVFAIEEGALANVFVQVPTGSNYKYSWDEESRTVVLEKVLDSPVYISEYQPIEYGYMQNTKTQNGDPLHGLVLTSASTHPGIVMEVRCVGLLKMKIDYLQSDVVITVSNKDKKFDNIHDINDVEPHVREGIEAFFEKNECDIEAYSIEVEGWGIADEANKLLKESQENYSNNK